MKRNHQWIPQALAALALVLAVPIAAQARTLGVEVWTDRGDDAVYQPGDAMQVKVRASDDAYLLVYEVDSEGRITLLYPWHRSSNMVEGHRTYRMPPERSGYELAVEKATGQGYIVAIASRQPFRDLPWYLRAFDPQADVNGYEDRHDEDEGFDRDGKVVGDPMVAMERIRRRVLDQPSDTEDFATSYATYYVGHEVRYPRYLCADCHRPGQWAWWDGFDPYYTQCSVFDFRVNWNWCWGPCIWTGRVPYFFYVVRSDCPPHYRGWYDDRSRWSSWDGRDRWNGLWGGNLTRYKAPPPPGYLPPTPTSKPGWNPPGYLPPGGISNRRGSARPPVPIGRGREDNSGPRPDGGNRGNRGFDPPRMTPPDNDGGSTPSKPAPRPAPAMHPPRDEKPSRETPHVNPPRQEQPRQESPRVDPPRQEQPRQEQPRQESPRRESEHKDPPKQDAPQDRPQRDNSDRPAKGR